jgi:hypothetical protein
MLHREFLLVFVLFGTISGSGTWLVDTRASCHMTGELLAQGKTQGSPPRAHQQALTIFPFENTCEADAVSLEVVIEGCRTQVSTTRGNAEWIHSNNTQSPSYSLSPLNLLRKLYFRYNQYHNSKISNDREHNINHTQHKIYVVHPLPRAMST